MRRYSNVDILLLAMSCICWCTIADSVCIPIADSGGIIPPPPADSDPLDGIVPCLLLTILADSIEFEFARDRRLGDVLLWSQILLLLLSLAADGSAYSGGSAGGFLVSVMGCGGPPMPSAAPTCARRLDAELARRRRLRKRETGGGGCACPCCCCQVQYEGRSPSDGLRPGNFLGRRLLAWPPLPGLKVKARHEDERESSASEGVA